MKSSRLEIFIKFLTMVPFFTLTMSVILMTTGVEHDAPFEVAGMATIFTTMITLLICDVN